MTSRLETRPEASEYAPSHAGYVALVPEGNIVAILEAQPAEVRGRLASLSPAAWDFRYGPGKWSIKEVLGHMIDSERVFAYRALSIARGERQSLPGFDENDYAAASDLSGVSPADLLDQLEFERRANALLFRSLSESAWASRGVANAQSVTPRGIAFVMAGHVRHHLEVLRTRYLAAQP
jgi:hypothetical protein